MPTEAAQGPPVSVMQQVYDGYFCHLRLQRHSSQPPGPLQLPAAVGETRQRMCTVVVSKQVAAGQNKNQTKQIHIVKMIATTLGIMETVLKKQLEYLLNKENGRCLEYTRQLFG